MHLKRTLAFVATLGLAVSMSACGSSDKDSSSKASGGGDFGNCKVTSKKGSIKVKPVKAGTLTVETTLPAQGWWNGTTPQSIKDGYEYCLAANLANAAGLKSVTV
jgi:polar amino acid transport system substrate-binding protein